MSVWRIWRRSPKQTLYFAPDYRSFNPFQSMLNAALGPGITAVPVPAKQVVQGLRDADAGSVFHLHWTAPVLQWSKDHADAERRLADFVEALTGFQARSGKLVWSIHNALPHDSKFPDLDLDLARLLAERADRIHVLSPDTSDLVANVYALDARRTVVIEHSSYLGQYPDEVSRADARARLGVDQHAKVIVALGGIRPYKGLNRLLDAFETIVDDDARLLIAGQPRTGEFADELRRRCEANPRVVAHFARVPDDELQVWLRAADLAALPYLDILNSGGYWLATTFGLPVVAPRAGTLAQFDNEPHVRLFEPGSPESGTESLGATLEQALRELVGDEAASASARAAARSRSPQRMAAEYATFVRGLFAS
jgi:glycosyltransferase involved in cell wall biosynthesis